MQTNCEWVVRMDLASVSKCEWVTLVITRFPFRKYHNFLKYVSPKLDFYTKPTLDPVLPIIRKLRLQLQDKERL